MHPYYCQFCGFYHLGHPNHGQPGLLSAKFIQLETEEAHRAQSEKATTPFPGAHPAPLGSNPAMDAMAGRPYLPSQEPPTPPKGPPSPPPPKGAKKPAPNRTRSHGKGK
jgi:hypothetical protein